MTGFTLEIVKVKASFPWAIKATLGGSPRYRGYHYKKEAIRGLSEWEGYQERPSGIGIFRDREFWHNFHSAEELGIKGETI